mgnify:CR=1 FL=1
MATKEFFPGIEKIKFEGKDSKNPMAFRYYNAEKVINGKKMKDWLRFAMAWWHTLCAEGGDQFGGGTKQFPWNGNADAIQAAKDKMDAGFEFMQKMGIEYYCFHDVDLVSEGASVEEYEANLKEIVAYAKQKQAETGIKLLWGTANVFGHARYMNGAATNPDFDVVARAAVQIKNAIDATIELGGENYVFWGGREGYMSLLNTDQKREKEHLAQVVCECLHLDCPEPDLADWTEMVEKLRHPTQEVTVALVGKYIQLHDAYISVVEALKHGGVYNSCDVTIKWIDSETVTPETADELLSDVSGILVPGGFGDRGTEGKIEAIRYAREHNIPFLGLCLGMQLSIVEFARNVIGYDDAHSVELNPNTTHPVIHLMPDQEGIDDIGGTLRLGSYPCVLDKTSKAYELYGEELIHERHRHRYEVNNDYRKVLTENGMMLSGISPDGRIVEMIELKNHPWFIATQAHPELKSRPNRPHPLFRGFITATLEYQNKNH